MPVLLIIVVVGLFVSYKLFAQFCRADNEGNTSRSYAYLTIAIFVFTVTACVAVAAIMKFLLSGQG
jgi:hypothetical protein